MDKIFKFFIDRKILVNLVVIPPKINKPVKVSPIETKIAVETGKKR